MKIRLVGAEWFHAEGRTDRHDEANNRLSQYCEYTKNTTKIYLFKHSPIRALFESFALPAYFLLTMRVVAVKLKMLKIPSSCNSNINLIRIK